MNPWRGIVQLQRQLNEPQTTVLIKSRDRTSIFRLIALDDSLRARFADRPVFYAQAVIRQPAVGYGGFLDGALEIENEVQESEWI